jgi:hypothetical protein
MASNKSTSARKKRRKRTSSPPPLPGSDTDNPLEFPLLDTDTPLEVLLGSNLPDEEINVPATVPSKVMIKLPAKSKALPKHKKCKLSTSEEPEEIEKTS